MYLTFGASAGTDARRTDIRPAKAHTCYEHEIKQNTRTTWLLLFEYIYMSRNQCWSHYIIECMLILPFFCTNTTPPSLRLSLAHSLAGSFVSFISTRYNRVVRKSTLNSGKHLLVISCCERWISRSLMSLNPMEMWTTPNCTEITSCCV